MQQYSIKRLVILTIHSSVKEKGKNFGANTDNIERWVIFFLI